MIKFNLSQKPFYNFQHTALTDVVFLLMIFFLLTSTFVARTAQELKLAGKTGSPTRAKFIEIKILNNRIFIGQNETFLPQFENVLKNRIQEENTTSAIFKVAPKTYIRDLKKILEISRQAGIEKFSLEVE